MNTRPAIILPTVSFPFVLGALWMAFSGRGETFLLLLGAVSVVLVILLSLSMGLVDDEGVPARLLPGAPRYWPWLVVEVVKSSLDVSRRVVDPALPIDPVEGRVATGQSTDLGRCLFANSITLTPGTVSTGVDEHGVTFHALTAAAAGGLAAGEMDRRVTRWEG